MKRPFVAPVFLYSVARGISFYMCPSAAITCATSLHLTALTGSGRQIRQSSTSHCYVVVLARKSFYVLQLFVVNHCSRGHIQLVEQGHKYVALLR